jgi:hypothetical protein
VTASWEQDIIAASYEGYVSDHHASAGCGYQGSYGSYCARQEHLYKQAETAFTGDESLLLVEQEIAQLVAMRQRLVSAAAAAPLGSQLSAVCHAVLRLHTETLLVAFDTREALQQQQGEEFAAAEEEALMWQQHSAAQQQQQAEMAWYDSADHGGHDTYFTPQQQQQQQQQLAWGRHKSSGWNRQFQGYAAGAVRCQQPTDMQTTAAAAAAAGAAAAHAEQFPQSQPQLMQLLPLGNNASL